MLIATRSALPDDVVIVLYQVAGYDVSRYGHGRDGVNGSVPRQLPCDHRRSFLNIPFVDSLCLLGFLAPASAIGSTSFGVSGICLMSGAMVLAEFRGLQLFERRPFGVLVDDHSLLVHLREDVENRLRDVDQPFVDPFPGRDPGELVGDPFRLYCQGLLDPYRGEDGDLVSLQAVDDEGLLGHSAERGELVYPLVLFFRDAEADRGVSPPAFSVQALNAHGLLLLRS